MFERESNGHDALRYRCRDAEVAVASIFTVDMFGLTNLIAVCSVLCVASTAGAGSSCVDKKTKQIFIPVKMVSQYRSSKCNGHSGVPHECEECFTVIVAVDVAHLDG